MKENPEPGPRLAVAEDAVLVVIDVQERLMPAICRQEEVLANTLRLVQFANIIGLPVIFTEQEKLGATLSEVKGHFPLERAISKVHFNCFSCGEFEEVLGRTGRKTLVLAGVEAHICVTQTAIYGLGKGFNVHVVGDAVSSRTDANSTFAVERMRQAGATITSTEMFIYELLAKAGTDQFKAALRLVK